MSNKTFAGRLAAHRAAADRAIANDSRFHPLAPENAGLRPHMIEMMNSVMARQSKRLQAEAAMKTTSTNHKRISAPYCPKE